MIRATALALALAALTGCSRTEKKADTAAQPAVSADTARPWRKPGDKIDSILPMAEYLRRFREGLIEPKQLTGGEPTREALARKFLAAVSAQDTTALGHLLISRAEFAWLVFPAHVYSRPPYELDPAIFWLQIQAGSQKGLTRLLKRLGGQPLTLLLMRCQRDTLQVKAGPAQLWSDCRMRYRRGAEEESHRLFGSIVERDGRFKLFSLANDF